jgi:hypothetical protein
MAIGAILPYSAQLCSLLYFTKKLSLASSFMELYTRAPKRTQPGFWLKVTQNQWDSPSCRSPAKGVPLGLFINKSKIF